jgi:anti-sigma factor RsiW
MSGRDKRMLTCQEMVELVTDYLEGRIDDAARRRFEEHVAECEACTLYIEQMRLTIRAIGHIPPESISPDAREELVAAFRDWREGTV